MKVWLSIPSMAKKNGGPVAVVRDLADHLSDIGCKVSIATQAAIVGEDEWLPQSPLIEVIRVVGVGLGQPDWAPLPPDIIHEFGIWSHSNHRVVSDAVKFGIPLVISPCGMLNPWALKHKRLKKKLAWFLYQKRDLQRARLIVATAEDELLHIKSRIKGQPVAVVPNGIDIQDVKITDKAQSEIKTALFLGRIHQVKGLINLVEAWAKVKPEGWRCVIAGPDEGGHQAEVEACIHKNQLDSIFELIGPVDGVRKASVLRDADLFVLPSFTENFGIAAAEAMAAGLPVITTIGTPWEEIQIQNCGWWVELGVEPLAIALEEATSLPHRALVEKGKRSQKFVSDGFAWPKVAQQMKNVYDWVLGGGIVSECINR